MRRWDLLAVAVLSAAAAVAAEWQRAPGLALTSALGLLAAWAIWAAVRLGGFGSVVTRVAAAGAGAATLLALSAALDTWALYRLRTDWPARREATIAAASQRLDNELKRVLERARVLATRAEALLPLDPPAGFAELERLVDSRPTTAIALYDREGRPRVWAGPHRAAIGPDGPALEAFTSGFYVWLVARRQTSAGTAVATVLLARRSGVPQAGTSLADMFAAATGVSIRVVATREAPHGPDVFDFIGPLGDTLFAVVPVPPEQAVARDARLTSARLRSLALAGLGLLAAAVAAVRLAHPFATALVPLGAALVLLVRAPLAETGGPGSLFWPDTYFAGILGPFSASVGHLALSGALAALLALGMWRRPPRLPSPARWAAMLSVFAAPYLLQDLARGITPPAGGVNLALWVTWQLALALAASALVLLAAALVRGPVSPSRAGAKPAAAAGIALLLAALGLWLWDPVDAWPEWYPYLWVPALLIAIRPMPIRSAVATIAVVSGSAAALLTWGSVAEGRMSLASRDIETLGDRADPLAIALLDRFARDFPAGSPPRTAGDLYILWKRSSLGAQGYPAALSIWDANVAFITHRLDLAELDLAGEDMRLVALEARAEGLPVVWPVLRVPGLYGLAALPLPDGRVVTAAVGPRSRAIAPTRLARVLERQAGEPEPPYTVVLTPPDPRTLPPAATAWFRHGWQIRGERVVSLPDGARHAHALIDLRGASPLLQRGALLLVLDVSVLIALWLLAELATGRLVPLVREWWPRVRRSLRVRLTMSLAAFFVLPTVSFAAWSYHRLEDEFTSARALLLQRTLRDAAAALGRAETEAPGAVIAAARQVDAPLLRSVNGVLVSVSDPVLTDLGLADHLVPAEAYRRLAHGDELEVVLEDQSSRALVGYRLLGRSERGDAVVLAAPEPLADATLRRREADLGIAVLVAVLVGLLAAVVLAAVASRALAQPIQLLREAALAVGSGTTPPSDAALPGELEPVYGALAQAARDVEKGRQAQRVLAWGEMARQVAHEIKNPLTPIRLGIQHLLRLARERPSELPATVGSTGPRLLHEIERLDSIARAFSRFAAPGAPALPLEAVDVSAVAHDVAQLYGAGGGGVPVTVHAPPTASLRASARRDELSEVLINLCDNARNAGARTIEIAAAQVGDRVTIEVTDDGRGIPADILPRVFEPRFSTTTSGSGLGLAIARRLVESWGGAIAVVSTGPLGTTVRITLRNHA